MCRKSVLYVLVFVAGLVCSWANTASAQFSESDVLLRKYGEGIHHYRQHNYVEAYDAFTDCLGEGKTRNPAVYFYRGMTLLQLGRPEDAKLDFQEGGQMELDLANNNMQSMVGWELMDIQGDKRLEIERYRVDAKLSAYKRRRTTQVLQQNASSVNMGQQSAQGTDGTFYSGDNVPGSSGVWEIDPGSGTEEPLAVEEPVTDGDSESSLEIEDVNEADSEEEDTDFGLDFDEEEDTEEEEDADDTLSFDEEEDADGALGFDEEEEDDLGFDEEEDADDNLGFDEEEDADDDLGFDEEEEDAEDDLGFDDEEEEEEEEDAANKRKKADDDLGFDEEEEDEEFADEDEEEEEEEEVDNEFEAPEEDEEDVFE